MKEIEDQTMLHHEKTVADSAFYMSKKAAEANQLLYTPEYLKIELMKSLGNSTKIYFGPSLQNLVSHFLEVLSGK